MKNVIRHDINIVQRGGSHHLRWLVKNLTEHRIPLKPGMLQLDESRPQVHARFQPIEWNTIEALEPFTEVVMLDQELHPDRVDNYRFTLEHYKTFGIEDVWNNCYYVTEKQRKNLVKRLNMLSDRELPQAWYLNKVKEDRELSAALTQSAGMPETIIEIHMLEGHNPDRDSSQDQISLVKM